MKLKKITYLILSYLGLILSAHAAEVSINASVSSNPVALSARFQYSIEVSGNSSSLPKVSFPDLAKFYVLSGPNTSTSMQWVNGKMSSSKTYSFILQAKKTGTITINSATAKVNGKTVASNVIQLKVVKGNSTAVNKSSGKKTKSTNDPTVSGSQVFLKTAVSKRKVYLGEEIDVEYKLYFNVSIRTYNIESVPANPGFWNEDFEISGQPQIHTEIVNGKKYSVAVIHKSALFATRAGKLTIEPITVTIETVVRSRRSRRNSFFDNFFDDPFNARAVKKTISSKAVAIEVKTPPQEEKPADFNGAVGRYNFAVKLDKNSVKVNEAVSLKIRLSGSGNIKLVELPKPAIPPDLEQYDPKINSSINHKGGKVSGSKTAEYILIPRIGGDFTLKPLSFSYFDTKEKKYVTLRSEPLKITVSGNGNSTSGHLAVGNSLNRSEVALLGSDIRFIKDEESYFRKIGVKPYLSSLFWGNIFGALLVLLLVFVYYEKKSKLESNVKLAKRKKAGKIAAKSLAKAKKILTSGDHSEYYKAVSAALRGFVQDKLFIDLTDFTMIKVEKALKDKGIPQEQVAEYVRVLEDSDFKQYANVGATLEEKKELFEKSKSILTKLEKWI